MHPSCLTSLINTNFLAVADWLHVVDKSIRKGNGESNGWSTAQPSLGGKYIDRLIR